MSRSRKAPWPRVHRPMSESEGSSMGLNIFSVLYMCPQRSLNSWCLWISDLSSEHPSNWDKNSSRIIFPSHSWAYWFLDIFDPHWTEAFESNLQLKQYFNQKLTANLCVNANFLIQMFWKMFLLLFPYDKSILRGGSFTQHDFYAIFQYHSYILKLFCVGNSQI